MAGHKQACKPSVSDGSWEDLSWQESAACRGMDTELFFPEIGSDALQVKMVCATCRVRS